jgi:hypothetical protein
VKVATGCDWFGCGLRNIEISATSWGLVASKNGQKVRPDWTLKHYTLMGMEACHHV